MKTTPILLWTAGALALLPVFLPRVAAQHVLLAEDEGKLSLVRAANGPRAMVEKNGKLEEIPTKGFVLEDAPEYLPAYIAVRDIDARTTSQQTNGGGQVNNNFSFSATIEADQALEDVFLVLYMETETGKKVLFLNGIGNMERNKSYPVIAFVPMDEPLGSGHYTLHLFSGGLEVFQPQIPFFDRERALDRMVAKRIEGVQSAPPKFFLGSPPLYPAGLKKSGLKGQAVISVRIDGKGSVDDPVIKSASDPAFGTAALAAIREWRYLPRVKDGNPVETKADVPFVFSPPDRT
jgi:TonB family protein